MLTPLSIFKKYTQGCQQKADIYKNQIAG